MKHQVRIIGGRFRGKKITFPDSIGLRPTPDRIRETLFNWLMHTTPESRCLDAFAGSGALGFEAASRGASSVVLLEKEINVYRYLEQAIQTFTQVNIAVKHEDALDYLARCKAPFDVVFLDPPFACNLIPRAVHAIEHADCLKSGGMLYVESEQPISLNPEHWQGLKAKKAGMVYYALFKKLG